MSYSYRPSFISPKEFRTYMTRGQINKLFAIDGVSAASFIAREARLGNPIKNIHHNGNKFRPIDVWARAHAQTLPVTPPIVKELLQKAHNTREEITQLKKQIELYKAIKHKLGVNLLSPKLTKYQMLSEAEIIQGALDKTRISGVYFLIDYTEIIYVGQSVNVFSRVAQHNQNKSFNTFAYIGCKPSQLNLLESLYIHTLQPKLNGGKSNGKIAPMSLRMLMEMVETK